MAGLRTKTLTGAILMALALTACGGEGGVSVPTLPTERPTLPSVTLPTLPSVTLPTLPTVTLPTLPSVTLPTLPGSTPDATTDSPEATTPPAAEGEGTETTAPETEQPVAEGTEEPVAEETQTDGGAGWLWLLLLLLVGAAIAATVVVLRRRGNGAKWTDALEEPLTEASWLRDTLVPNVLAQGPDGRVGIWSIGRPRVLALQQRLRELVAQAPDVTSTRRVEALSAAVDALRRALDQAGTQVDFGGTSTAAALQQSQYELDDAIRALQPLPHEDGEQTPAG